MLSLSEFLSRWNGAARHDDRISRHDLARGGTDLDLLRDYCKLSHADQAWVRTHFDRSAREVLWRTLRPDSLPNLGYLPLPMCSAGVDRTPRAAPAVATNATPVHWRYHYVTPAGKPREFTGVFAVTFDGAAFHLSLKLRLAGKGASPAQLREMEERARAGMALVWDNAMALEHNGARYPLRVDVDFVARGAHGNVHVRPGKTSSTHWDPDAGVLTLGHELGHWLGLRDEHHGYAELNDDSIMGRYVDDDPPRVKARHAQRLAHYIGNALGMGLVGHLAP